MSKNDELWLAEYLRTGDAVQAIKDIFPDCSAKWAPSRASHLKAKMADQIDQALTKEIKGQSIVAFRIMADLMVNASQESIKYKAASDILNRAGFTEVHRFENVTKDQSYKELITSLRASLGSLDSNVLSEILTNSEDIKQIQLMALGQVGTEQ